MDDNHLFRPLLPATTPAVNSTQYQNNFETSTSSYSSIIIRLSTVLFIGIISIWANFAASSTFDITIINDIQDFPARNRFKIFYISDDKATRIIQNTTSFIQNIFVNPNTIKFTRMKNKIEHVTLRFSTAATTGFTVRKTGTFHELLINVSVPEIIGDLKRLDFAVKSMVLEGMAWIWVSVGGAGEAPPWIVDGLVEYVKRVAGYGDVGREFYGDFCLGDKEKDPKCVALFLEYCESIQEGFIQRFAGDFRYGWDDPTVEDTFKLSIQRCGLQKSRPQ